MESVLAAAITGVFAVIGQALITFRTQRETKVREAVKEAKREEWETRVERKLDIHNGYAEKFGEIQTDIAVIKTELKNLYGKEGRC